MFVSYIHEEEYLADALQRQLSELLLGGIEFFVSGLPTSIDLGQRWLEQIDDALRKASAALIICSNHSIYHPWINFEAGAAWLSQALGHCPNVIPVCHSGLRPSQLNEPLRSLQALDITNEVDIRKLVELLARIANLNAPQFDPTEFIASLPPSGHLLEAQQMTLQKTLELTSSTLKGKIEPEAIQQIVTGIVEVWSRSLYNLNKPPPPIGVPPFPQGINLLCNLCDTSSSLTEQGCCPRCGLFCSNWLRTNSG